MRSQRGQGGYQQGRGGAAQSIGKTTRAKILQLESEFDRIAHDRNELNYMNQQLIA